MLHLTSCLSPHRYFSLSVLFSLLLAAKNLSKRLERSQTCFFNLKWDGFHETEDQWWTTYTWSDWRRRHKRESWEWNFQKGRLRYGSIGKSFLPTFFPSALLWRQNFGFEPKQNKSGQRAADIWRRNLAFLARSRCVVTMEVLTVSFHQTQTQH